MEKSIIIFKSAAIAIVEKGVLRVVSFSPFAAVICRLLLPAIFPKEVVDSLRELSYIGKALKGSGTKLCRDLK